MLLSVHGNKKQPLSWTIPSQTLKEVVKVKLNFTEAVLFPGCVPSFERTDVWLLPSVLTLIFVKVNANKAWVTQNISILGNNCVYLIKYLPHN